MLRKAQHATQINQVTLLVVDADRTEGSEGLVRDAKATLSRLDVAHTPAPLSQYRYLILYPGHNITHSSGWPTRDERWSGSLANSKEADAAGALLQGRKLINGNLGISHTMIRTGTNQWSVLKRVRLE